MTEKYTLYTICKGWSFKCDLRKHSTCPMNNEYSVSMYIECGYWRIIMTPCTGADPGFEKGGGAGVQGLAPKIVLANLMDFLKNLAQKGVGMRPPPLWIRAWCDTQIIDTTREDKTWHRQSSAWIWKGVSATVKWLIHPFVSKGTQWWDNSTELLPVDFLKDTTGYNTLHHQRPTSEARQVKKLQTKMKNVRAPFPITTGNNRSIVLL